MGGAPASPHYCPEVLFSATSCLDRVQSLETLWQRQVTDHMSVPEPELDSSEAQQGDSKRQRTDNNEAEGSIPTAFSKPVQVVGCAWGLILKAADGTDYYPIEPEDHQLVHGCAAAPNGCWFFSTERCILRTTEKGIVTVICEEPLFNQAGTQVRSFSVPSALVLSPDGSSLFVADSGHNTVRRVSIAAGTVDDLAGDFEPGYHNGTASAAKFNCPCQSSLHCTASPVTTPPPNCHHTAPHVTTPPLYTAPLWKAAPTLV